MNDTQHTSTIARPIECIVCGEAETCECVDPFSPDFDPTDADLAPRWDAIPVDEQHAIAGRIKTALKDGAL